jgi:hypothetical protein
MFFLSPELYSRVLVRFNFKHSDFFKIPLSPAFPTTEIQDEYIGGERTGKLMVEKENLNAEFLLDFLEETGFFLQKGFSRIYKNSKPHSVAFFYFGDKKKKVRKVQIIRKVFTELLGDAVWSVRIYENPGQDSFPLTINFSCRKPYFAQSGEPLDNKSDFVMQRINGGLIFEPTNMKQNSAA